MFPAFSGAEETEVQSPRTAKQAQRKKKQRAWLYNEVRASSSCISVWRCDA